MVSTSAKKLINIATFISLFFHLILIFCSHCQLFLRISGFTKICNKKITFQCIIFIVPEEGWFGQPKYSTHIKTFLRCTGFCLYFLHFIYVKPVRSPLIQRTPAGSSFRLLAQTFCKFLSFFSQQSRRKAPAINLTIHCLDHAQ